MYTSDLTDEQWARVKPFFKGMRIYKWSKRLLLNAVFYLNATGCQWRNLPKDFPPYQTVNSFYNRARKSGLWDKILTSLVKTSRLENARDSSPSYGIVDSQSVKTVYHGDAHGIDGGKKNQRT